MGHGTQSVITQVEHLLAGRLVIPSIQREFVWRKAQVPYLLDSLYRGYPVGSLLVWNTSQDVPLKRAAVLQDEEQQLRPGVLLDGQQRLTSLAKVVAPERVTGARLDVRFNLENQVFLNASASDRKNPRLVPVTDLLNVAPQFGALLSGAGVGHDAPLYDTFYDRLRRVHQIRDYQMPVTTIDVDDYEVVAEIFARVNQGGRRLSKGDLVYSAIAARWNDGLDVIDAFNDELRRQAFGLDREAVLRLTGLLAGSGAHVIKLIASTVSGEDLQRAWADTERALRFAVDFLRDECGIPRSAVLSSPNVVAIPAYLLFLRANRLDREEVDGLRRWVYTAMAFSYYSNQVEGKLDADARLCRDLRGAELIGALIRRASGPRPVGAAIEPNDLTSRKSSSSWFNLLYIAALRRGSRDWFTNRALSDGPMNSNARIEYHHVFPRAKVAKRFGAELTNQVANLAFISGETNRRIASRSPEVYLVEVEKERLREQHVPHDPRLWAVDDFPDFLAARRALLAEVLNEMLGLDRHRSEPVERDDVELPDDDVEIDVESRASVPPSRRNVALHIREAFAGLEPGAELTVGEIVAVPSTQYDAGEISPGAVRVRLEAGTVPGIEVVANRAPMSARRVARASADEVFAPTRAKAEATTDRRSRARPVGRRDVGQHVKEVFAALPSDADLTIGEIVARASSQYAAGEISAGAIAARFDASGVAGFEIFSSWPRRIRRTRSASDS